MKPKYLIIAAAILVLSAVFLIRNKPEISPALKPAPSTATADGMNLAIDTDSTRVFQKAFWRHPTSEDQILQAERREWSAEDGVQRWQWFIAVRPGPQLLEWLDTNPFSMAVSESGGAVENPPEWFPKSPEGFQIMKNTEGHFIIMLSPDQKRLYATDEGHGFTPPGVQE